jgi:CTD kinase subunit alpha
MFVSKPVFNGSDEISQLDSIYELMGTISGEEWPEAEELPWKKVMTPKEARPRKLESMLQE